MSGEFSVDGASLPFEEGDSVAVAIVRSGAWPSTGGTLCLAGDCGNCLVELEGIAYVRSCQVVARGGPRFAVIPLKASRSCRRRPTPSLTSLSVAGGRRGRHRWRARRAAIRRRGRVGGQDGRVLDLGDGREAVGMYPGPAAIAREPGGMLHVIADEIVVATGAAEVQPVCPGNRLAGL